MNQPRKNPLIVDLESMQLTITSLREIKDPLRNPPKIIFQGFTKEVILNYTCMICQEVYNDPVTTTCECAANLCSQCFKRNSKKCPICRKYTESRPNLEINRYLQSQEIVCRCGIKYYHGSKDSHDIICIYSKFTCFACKREFNGPGMVNHLESVHYFQILATMGKYQLS